MADVFTQSGEEILTDILDGTIALPTWHGQWGTGGSGAAKGNTALGVAGPEARVVCVMSQPTTDTNRFLSTITATGTRAVIEFGLFTALSAGTLIARSDFTAINVVVNDRIEFTPDMLHS